MIRLYQVPSLKMSTDSDVIFLKGLIKARFFSSDSTNVVESTKKVKESSSKTTSDKEHSLQLSAATAPYFGYLSGVASSLWKVGNFFGASSEEQTTKSSKPKFIIHRASRTEIVERTSRHVIDFLSADSNRTKILRIDELNRHLMVYPASRMVAVENSGLTKKLLQEAKYSEDTNMRAKSQQCLALCGYVAPPRGRGVCVLSIDGGGTRGMMGLEVIDQLEKCVGGRKISDIFDIIVGVSTGAIIATLLGAKRMNISDTKRAYMEISRKLFDQGKFSGVRGLLLSHSYYNTTKWVEILKEMLDEDFSLIETSQNVNSPKLALISCVVNSIQLQPFVFRNYEHPPGCDSHYRGSTQYKAWQAIQASAAAPGYFEEVLLGSVLHQDGGVLVNNPTAIALHESRLLWPNESIQTLVSIGNGRSVSEVEFSSAVSSTWVHEKLTKIIDSATDTELVHNCISDLLPPHVYFRLNPYMSAPYTLDEIRPEKLAQMERDAKLYVRRNRRKIQAAANHLMASPTLWQRVKRSILR